MHAIEEISPETFKSADKLIHCVNPTSVPLWDAKSGRIMGKIPSEWTHMEKCLHTFIYDQFHFHKLSPIKHYLQKLTHDVILFAQLSVAMAAPKIDETTVKICQLQDSIGRLEDGHDKAYIEAKENIDVTISDIRDCILLKMNDLKKHPEKFISKEMISRIDLKKVEAELDRLIQKRWKEIEKECNQRVNRYIQECIDRINHLVEGLPKSSTHDDFIPIKMMLQDIDFNVSGIRESKKSLKSKVQETAQDVLSSLKEASTHSWTRIMYRTAIDKINKYSKKGLKMIMGGDERIDEASDESQERR
jgi:hypothetical protein